MEYCESNKIKPWEFDFKHVDGKNWLVNGKKSSFTDCIIMGAACDHATSNFRLEIAYSSAKSHDTETLPSGKGDCDTKASPMYRGPWVAKF